MKKMILIFTIGFLSGFLALFIWAWFQINHSKLNINTALIIELNRLPFNGKWEVFWGGDSAKDNAHFGAGVQHYAIDFVSINPKGHKTHSGQGKVNSDYYCWGREIFSPSNGVVTMVVTGISDNTPSVMNASMIYGNVVFIEHSSNVFGVYAHLQDNSVSLKVGDRVSVGDKIGLCGNSGNSSEPHLHFHLQSTNEFNIGDPVCPIFKSIIIDDILNENSRLGKGQIVSNIEVPSNESLHRTVK